ncbi:MAG TPA: alpha/beta hydrolase [Polyangiales bacterium]
MRRGGKRGAPRVLFTGAWPTSVHGWDPVWRELESEHELLALDLPGFGRSEPHRDGMSPRALARVLGRFLRALDFEDAHGVFPDVGVPLGLALLRQGEGSLRGATLANGPMTYPLSASWGLRVLIGSALVRRATARAPDLFVDQALRQGYARARPTAELAETYRDCYRGGRLAGSLAYLASYERELGAIVEDAAQITAPITILWGKRDPFLHADNATTLAARLPHARQEWLPEAGHLSHEDEPEAFVNAVRSQTANRPRARSIPTHGA